MARSASFVASLLLLASVAPDAFAATPAPAPAPAPVARQDEAPPPDKRPEVKALIEAYGDAVAKRGDADAEAISVLENLLREFEASGPKDKEAIAKAVGASLTERRKELAPEQPDERLGVAAATALGRMGDAGGTALLKHLDHKNLRERPASYRAAILALGNTRHAKGVKELIGLLPNHDAAVQAAAAEALGNYDQADQKVRKEIFKELLETIMPVKNVVDTDATDAEAKRRFDTIATPILGSMKKVSRHEEPDLQAWQRWWNHNKNGDWGDA